MVIRDVSSADGASIVALNNASIPALPTLEATELGALLAHCGVARVAECDGVVMGFLLAMPSGTAYSSDNYRWFSRRFADFWYVDRVAVEAGAWGRGLGRALYADLETHMRARGAGILACEVNEKPPNPQSLAFHQRLGFQRLETRVSDAGKTVVMLMKDVNTCQAAT